MLFLYVIPPFPNSCLKSWIELPYMVWWRRDGIPEGALSRKMGTAGDTNI